jgi:biopolymer transport protein ExbD
VRLEVRRPARRLVSLTPLIDVVFILLLFFMLATRFEHWQELPLSAAEAGTGLAERGAVLVRLGPDGRVDLNGRPVLREALEAEIAARLAGNPDRRFLVQAAPGVPLQQAVAVLDRLDAAGARDAMLLAAPGSAREAGR